MNDVFDYFNPFQATVPFLSPLNISNNFCATEPFRGLPKACSLRSGNVSELLCFTKTLYDIYQINFTKKLKVMLSWIQFLVSHKLGQNICRLFHFLGQVSFTISETELDYYQQKVNVQIASRVVERLKNENPPI